MNYSTDPNNTETLLETIRKISGRLGHNGSKQDSAHSQFLMEMIDDMMEQVESSKYSQKTSSEA